jgi:hypothetical protein
MSQIDMLSNQAFEEVLRERTNYYFAKNKKIDFWISLNPTFLSFSDIKDSLVKSNFYEQKKLEISQNNYDFYSVLISSNSEFINWIKLRTGYFENIKELNNQQRKFTSDGIYGEISSAYINENYSTKSLNSNLNPKLILPKFEKSIEVYYKKMFNK